MAIQLQDQYDNQLQTFINRERVKANLDRIQLSQKLDTAADQYAQEMAEGDFLNPVNPRTGEKTQDRVQSAGYQFRFVAELVAGGDTSPGALFDRWLKDNRARAIILDPRAKHIGVGYHFLNPDLGQAQFKHYWSFVEASGDDNPGRYIPDETGTPPPPSSTLIKGTSQADRLQGDDKNNTILGLAGNDILVGLAGNDRLNGGPGNDKLLGGDGRDKLVGGRGNDILRGGKDSDTLIGVNPSDKTPLVGKNEIDVLIGGPGADRFQLGDRRRVYYDDGRSGAGRQDYASIQDFDRAEGDRIVLHGEARNYRLTLSGIGSQNGTLITFLSDQGQEVIGFIRDVKVSNLNAQFFIYLG